MSTTIEISTVEHNEGLLVLLQGLCNKYNRDLNHDPDNNIIYIHLHKHCWYIWKRTILRYAKHHMKYLQMEIDKDGDEEDENLKVVWDGTTFTFEYSCAVY